MKPYELYQLSHLAQLLGEVATIIARYQKEEVPDILEDLRGQDHPRQMTLPFGDPDEPDPGYFPSAR